MGLACKLIHIKNWGILDAPTGYALFISESCVADFYKPYISSSEFDNWYEHCCSGGLFENWQLLDRVKCMFALRHCKHKVVSFINGIHSPLSSLPVFTFLLEYFALAPK